MIKPKLALLGLSGSLRATSTNTALLRAAAAAAPDDIRLHLFDRLAELPIFNPDLEEGRLPEAVAALRHEVMAADGLVFAVPEYAHGIPGGLKNALDWLVSGSEIPGKPVAFFHASPRSHHGRAALAEVLRTMSTRIVVDITVPLLGLAPDAIIERLAGQDTMTILRRALADFADHVRSRQSLP